MPTYRNPCANNPLLRKGGTHIRSKTGQRSRDHYDLLDEAAACFDEYRRHKKSEIDYEPVIDYESGTDDQLIEVKGEHDAPLSFINSLYKLYAGLTSVLAAYLIPQKCL